MLYEVCSNPNEAMQIKQEQYTFEKSYENNFCKGTNIC
jgi:hypothetical protein